MANLFDYLLWRGDLPFSIVPPSEADKLLLAQLSYVFFDGIVPSPLDGGAIPLGEAAQKLLSADPDAKIIHQIGYMWRDDKKLLEMLTGCARYKDLLLSDYVSTLEEDAQFGALSIKILPGLTCVSFRGTDDSIIGWKEDCALSFNDPVPAQLMSADYLTHIAGRKTGELLIVGHSKGGNLAVYSAATADKETRERIKTVVSCDGPGLNHILINTEGYRSIAPRIEKYVPQSSVVGMLLEYDDHFTVISSDGVGLLQHSAFSWQIMGPTLIRRSQPTQTSRYINMVIKEWLDDMDIEKRKVFVGALFEVLAKTDLTSVDQLDMKFFLSLPTALIKMRTVDPAVRTQLRAEIRALMWRALHPNAEQLAAPETEGEKEALSVPGAPEINGTDTPHLSLPELPRSLKF